MSNLKIKKDKTYIIAEIGGNFTTYEQAVKLIDGTKYAGVDCIKLQTYKADTISSKKIFFNLENTGKISQYEYFKKFELPESLTIKVVDYIKSVELDWFSTPSHEDDLEFLLSLGMKAVKIGADDATNLPFLKNIAKTGLMVALSTGMCTLEEVKEAVNTILAEGNDNIIIFHTVSNYPTYPEDLNLNIINTFKKDFPEFKIGFSDHSLGPLASITAAAMGANIIERHFTYDKNADGPDHMISSTPEEMKYIVDSIRMMEKMKGSAIKKPYGGEVGNRIDSRKSILARNNIKKGDRLTKENICIKRPGSGIQPKYYDQILGKISNSDFEEDHVFQWGDFS